jgi:glycerol uptake facilitator protein
MHPYFAEFLGTLLLILMGNGVVANVVLPQTKGHAGGWIVITFGWGLGVFIAVWCVGAASGAHLNPAITIGLYAAGKLKSELVLGYIGAQLAGALAGAALVLFYYWDH